jgi:hypothetical protein
MREADRTFWRGAGLLCLMAAVGCGADEHDAAPAMIVRDSAGVEIIENVQAAWPAGQGWRLSEEPLLTIGTVDGEPATVFDAILGVRRLANGTVVVADRRSSELRFFGADGAFLRSVGGEGDGPGEFRFMSLFWVRGGNTLVVSHLPGLSEFDAEGRFLRTMALDPGSRPSQPVAQIDDGTILGLGGGRPPAPANPGTLTSSELTFTWFAPDGSLRAPITSLPGRDTWHSDNVGPLGRHVPFTAGPAWGTSGTHVYLAGGGAPEIQVWSPGGLERLVRWEPSRHTTREILPAYREHLLASSPTADSRRRLEAFLAEVPLPEGPPATGEQLSILVEDDGVMWARGYPLPWEDAEVWEVFSDEGRWLGSVPMPPRFELHQAGRDFVLGIWRDEVGVEFVRQYRITGRD